MSIIDDCVQFLEDLLLGDFNEQQMVSAQIIGGVISLVPVVDQVMDVRDVSGNLYRINKQGGFAKATLEQKIDFGFAAFGVVPEIGSAFKTVFKPIYKQRKAVKGVINSGVAMIELMLGQRKGGAVRWVRALDWAGNTQAAILQANMALESCIALLDTLGQEHWWCPDRLRNLARDVAPGLKALRGQLDRPIREAAVEIREFLEDMLGEHAAAVAMAVAGNVTSLPRAGSGRGATRATSNSGRQQHHKIQDSPRIQGKPAGGATVNVVQRLAYEGYKVLDLGVKGLMGQHIVDHHVIEQKGWGLMWNRHDMLGPAQGVLAAGWGSTHKKLNDDECPLFLCTPSARVFANGIDSLWHTSRASPRAYAVVEAKAHMNPKVSLLQLLGETQGQHSPAKVRAKRSRPGANRSNNSAGSQDPSLNRSGKILQMSKEWIHERLLRSFRSIFSDIDGNYSRHVFLVTPVQAAEHVIAVEKIVAEHMINNPVAAQAYAASHSVHNVEREFDDSELDAALRKYQVEGKPKKSPKGK